MKQLNQNRNVIQQHYYVTIARQPTLKYPYENARDVTEVLQTS